MVTNKYGNALVQTQKNNFAPRVGFAYQAMPQAGGARRAGTVL